MKIKAIITVEFDMSIGTGYITKKRIKNFILNNFVAYKLLEEEEVENCPQGEYWKRLRQRIIPQVKNLKVGFEKIEKQ